MLNYISNTSQYKSIDDIEVKWKIIQLYVKIIET